jgi:cell division protein FtsQ
LASNHAALRTQKLWHNPNALELLSDLLLIGVTLIIAHGILAWFSSRPVFAIREIWLASPPVHTSTAQIEYVARSSTEGKNFFTMDLKTTRDALERLPWVRKAEVRRRWPAALDVRLEEQEAVAYWMPSDSDTVQLVNAVGTLFSASSDRALPLFTGPQGSAARVLEMYHRLSPLLEPLSRRPVEVLLSERASWQVKLDDGLVLRLGRDVERASLDERLARFVRLWPETAQQLKNPAVEVDLRYPGGFAVRLLPQQGDTETRKRRS